MGFTFGCPAPQFGGQPVMRHGKWGRSKGYDVTRLRLAAVREVEKIHLQERKPYNLVRLRDGVSSL